MYNCANYQDRVIKIEKVGMRTIEDFLKEVLVQNEASKNEFIASLDVCEVAEYDRELFGNAAPGKCWFYVIVMKKYPYSL